MKRGNTFVWPMVLLFLTIQPTYAQEEPTKIIQEEESAEVFLEEYTDEFQNTFFEALKQKGIQNYDRAVNLFLDCKRLDSINPTIDHELAKTYLLDNKYMSAQDFALKAVNKEPGNYWFTNTLVEVLEKQSYNIDRVQESIPFKNDTLKQNLATIYFKRALYSAALEVLQKLKASTFKKGLRERIEDSLSIKNKANAQPAVNTDVTENNNPAKKLQLEFEQLIGAADFATLERQAKDATEEYPLQPFFYYAYGLALSENKKYKEAIDALEAAQDFIFEQNTLSQKIFEQLAKAHSILGNESKANEYRNKMKSGL